MRLKTYTAATTAEAMALVRQEMGEDAIVVSTQKAADGRGVRVSAALEDAWAEDLRFSAADRAEETDIAATIRKALTFHGAPPRLAERLTHAAAAAAETDPARACARALDSHFTFRPLVDAAASPIMLIGGPGVGKTITTAKLAARATLSGRTVGVITTDTSRPGGIEQLAAFTRILQLDLKTADGTESLRDAVIACRGDEIVFIDTPGTNPFSGGDMSLLGALIEAAHAEPLLVLAAGADAMESADTAAAFAAIGARRLVLTRLDMVRRLGGVLAAADAARLAFSDVSVTPHVADGLSPITPLSLARLIVPKDTHVKGSPHMTEAAL